MSTFTTDVMPLGSYDRHTVLSAQKTFNDYIEAAKAFASQSATWFAVDPESFYTTDGGGGWEETSDNAHGGLDVSWAFHLEPKIIESTAPGHLIAEIRCVTSLED